MAPAGESAAEVHEMPVINWLFEPNPGTPSAWYIGLTALAVLVFIGCLLAYVFRRSLFPGNPLSVRLTERFALVGLLLGLLALIVLAARYLSVPFFQMRFWLVVAGLLIVAFAGYVAYFLRTRYPALREAYRTEMNRQRFIKPIRASGASGGQRHSKKRRR
jgi:hypothetical protein